MSRAPAAQQPQGIPVAPSNNVYTVLAAVGMVICIIGLAVMYLASRNLGVELLKM